MGAQILRKQREIHAQSPQSGRKKAIVRGGDRRNGKFSVTFSHPWGYTDEMPNDDLIMLREFARSRSESVFAVLVERHINLCHCLDTFCQFIYSGGSRMALSFLTRRQSSQ